MKDTKYHLYLTNEERSEVLKSLIDLKNEMIAQGRYTDVLDGISEHRCQGYTKVVFYRAFSP